MRRKQIGLVIMLLVSLILSGCAETSVFKDKNSKEYRQLKIIGDINNIINIGDLSEYEELAINENSIELQGIIKASIPYAKDFDVLIVGNDGLMARIDGKKISDCSLVYNDINGWCSITEKHPISTKIKDIKEIVVISNEKNLDKGITIFNREENLINITPGQLYLMRNEVKGYKDGESEKKYTDETYRVSVIKERKLLDIEKLVDIGDRKLLAFGGNGEYRLIDKGYLELYENKINYINTESREYIKDLKGILVDPPTNSNMDTYYDVSHYLEDDQDVMVIFVDGLGYHQFLKSSLAKIYDGKIATTVYKPVTNAGFAALISGKPPEVNGILNRKYREIKVDTIFDVATKLNKRSFLIEGELKILNTSVAPVLNIDQNKNGMVDDDILKKSIEILKERPNLIMVHFHSVDDYGHTYGDEDKNTYGQIEVISKYIEKLRSEWSGKIIITSDHGMHSVDDGGYHGSARYEDIMIPYILTKGDR